MRLQHSAYVVLDQNEPEQHPQDQELLVAAEPMETRLDSAALLRPDEIVTAIVCDGCDGDFELPPGTLAPEGEWYCAACGVGAGARAGPVQEALVAVEDGVRLHLSSSSNTGYRGVWEQYPGRFLARHTVDGRRIVLGTFDTAVEAATAYARAVGEASGRFRVRHRVEGREAVLKKRFSTAPEGPVAEPVAATAGHAKAPSEAELAANAELALRAGWAAGSRLDCYYLRVRQYLPRGESEARHGAKEVASPVARRVSHLVAQRVRVGARQYLVHWDGYSVEERSWEDEQDIHDKTLIRKLQVADGPYAFVTEGVLDRPKRRTEPSSWGCSPASRSRGMRQSASTGERGSPSRCSSEETTSSR